MNSKGFVYPTSLEDLKEPPYAADPDETASIARQGIIGQCLQEALNDIVAEDAAAAEASEKQKADGEEEGAKKPVMRLEKHMADNVMKEFGRAVARTNWTSTKDPKKVPPAALVRGRLDHYNRFNGKWRIVAEDARFKRRATLDKNRKKTNQRPLWDAVDTRCTSDPIRTLQILAHDDL